MQTHRRRQVKKATSSNKLIVLVRVRHPRSTHPRRLSLGLLRLPGGGASDRLAVSVQHIVLGLDELDRLPVLELLDGLRESHVEDLVALRRAARGVERVRNIRVGGRGGGAVGEIGGGVVG